jgi:hypothetical protein
MPMHLPFSPKTLDDYFQNQGSYFLVNYYPTCPNPKLAIGVGPHKDGWKYFKNEQTLLKENQHKSENN